MNISFVIPLFNEAESIAILIEEITSVLHDNTTTSLFGNNVPTYEIIVIDDGSTDGSSALLKTIAEKNSHLKIVSFQRNYGKSAALHAGFARAAGEYVITMDADLQDNPKEIPNLITGLRSFDLVNGWKRKRHDPLSKRLPSKFFNLVTRKLSGINIRDFNCGLKGYRNQVAKSIDVYGEMHRYLPVIAHKQGFSVTEIPVEHRARQYGKTKFGAGRFLNGFFDLMTVLFITKYMKRPMHFFGLIGVICFILGISTGLYLTYVKFVFNEGISQRPLLLFSVLFIILSVQFFSLGLLGEMITKSPSHDSTYIIKEEINF